ncbi:MAG: sugar transferase [Caldilineaceae bacterium]
MNILQDNTSGYRTPLAERWALLVLVDAICIVAAFWVATFSWALRHGDSLQFWYWLPLVLIGWWILAYFNNLYDIPSSCERLLTLFRIVGCALLGLLIYFAVTRFVVSPLPNSLLLTFGSIALCCIFAWRLLYVALSNHLFSPHRVLIIGFDDRGQSITQLLRPAAHLNYQIVGFVDDNPATAQMPPSDLTFLGRIADLSRLVQSLQIHEVVVAIKQALPSDVVELLITCQGQGVQVSWMADLYAKFRHSIPIQHIGPAWALYAIQGQPVFSRLQLVGKRCLDLLLVCLALPTLLIVIPLIALAIRLDSPGPIFYRQTRVGRGSRLFTIFKFRTMVPDAEKAGTPQWATKGDPRITRVGLFLRKTRLDELPQVLNILRGEMSFVGPRPERPEFVEQLEQEIPFYRTRLLVKPGLTGWAQIHYGYGNSADDALLKLQFDFYYIRHWSLWRDIYILFQTVAVVLLCKGT